MVRGEGEARALPDLAVLRVVVEGEGPSREQAYDAAAPLAGAVDEVIRQEADSIGRTTTAALTVQPRTRWRKGETVRTGWRAQRMSVVEIRALDRVGELAALLVSAGGSLSGPSWELDRSNQAYGRARHEAAVDARRRAEDYAQAIGVEVGEVVWVAEPGLRLAGQTGTGVVGVTRAARMAAGAAEEPIEVAPDEITVRATVEVGFTLEAH